MECRPPLTCRGSIFEGVCRVDFNMTLGIEITNMYESLLWRSKTQIRRFTDDENIKHAFLDYVIDLGLHMFVLTNK